MRPDNRLSFNRRRAALDDLFGSIKENFGDVLSGLAELVRSEIVLGKTELQRETSKLRKALPALAVGALLCVFAVGLALIAAVYALATVVPAWLAALIVSVGTGVAAGLIMRSGWNRISAVNLKPEETIQSMKENVVWLKSRLS